MTYHRRLSDHLPQYRPWHRGVSRGKHPAARAGEAVYYIVSLHLDNGTYVSGTFQVETGHDERRALDLLYTCVLRDYGRDWTLIDWGFAPGYRGKPIPGASTAWLDSPRWKDPK